MVEPNDRFLLSSPEKSPFKLWKKKWSEGNRTQCVQEALWVLGTVGSCHGRAGSGSRAVRVLGTGHLPRDSARIGHQPVVGGQDLGL